MINWLTVKTNPPPLDTEIIVKKSNQMKFTPGIYSKVMFFYSKICSETEMLERLETDNYDLWSDVT